VSTRSAGGPTVPPEEVRRRLVLLADELAAEGKLRSPAWREAFLSVARHAFVPCYLHDDEPGSVPARWRMVDSAEPADREEWVNAVYSDRTLITDLKSMPSPSGHGTYPVVTSSSTLPGLVIRMLEDLDVRDGNSVLEIGTGTGYNAALLCARLGGRNVTSVDIDPALVDSARDRLAAHGFHPHLVTGDGEQGVPDDAPYDRVIATCAVDSIPQPWIAQTRPGGAILANLRGNLMRGAQALLVVADDGTASGPFLPGYGSFMGMRHDPNAPFDYSVAVEKDTAAPADGTTDLDPTPLNSDFSWAFVAQTRLPDAITYPETKQDGTEGTEVATPDGSWAFVAHSPDWSGRYHTVQAGPRRLWDILEDVHRQWSLLGQPCWDRFGLTVTQDRQRIWFDSPDSGLGWPLRSAGDL
jgi:methyltransferase of ATP-grasp peptide maturase system